MFIESPGNGNVPGSVKFGARQIEMCIIDPASYGMDTRNADPSHGAQSRLIVAGKFLCSASAEASPISAD